MLGQIIFLNRLVIEKLNEVCFELLIVNKVNQIYM